MHRFEPPSLLGFFGLHLVARLLTFLHGLEVVFVAATASESEILASARDGVVEVALMGCATDTAHHRQLADVLCSCRALLLTFSLCIETIVVAAATVIVELLALLLAAVEVPLLHVSSAESIRAIFKLLQTRVCLLRRRLGGSNDHRVVASVVADAADPVKDILERRVSRCDAHQADYQRR